MSRGERRGPRWVAAPFLIALGMVVMAMPSAAQRVPRDSNRMELERRVRAHFGEMVRERLGLTEEKGRELGEVVAAFDEDRMSLRREEEALRRRIEAIFLEADTRSESSDEARELLTRMRDLRLREARLFASEQERLLEVLTPSQALRFLAMREQLGQRIRQLQDQRMRGRPPGGGMGGPGGPPGEGRGGGERPSGVDGWVPMLRPER